MKDPYKPLDKYEEELMRAIDNDEFVEVPNQSKEIKKIMSYFKDFPRKNKRLTLRIDSKDLEKIQNKAIETGIPYQTLITAIIRQYATGKIALKV